MLFFQLPFIDCHRIFKEIQTIEKNEFNFKEEVCMVSVMYNKWVERVRLFTNHDPSSTVLVSHRGAWLKPFVSRLNLFLLCAYVCVCTYACRKSLLTMWRSFVSPCRSVV